MTKENFNNFWKKIFEGISSKIKSLVRKLFNCKPSPKIFNDKSSMSSSQGTPDLEVVRISPLLSKLTQRESPPGCDFNKGHVAHFDVQPNLLERTSVVEYPPLTYLASQEFENVGENFSHNPTQSRLTILQLLTNTHRPEAANP